MIKRQVEKAAEIRDEALQVLATIWAMSGKQADTPTILRKGADVQSEGDFRDIIQFVEGLCERKVSTTTPTARLTRLGRGIIEH